MHGLDLYVKIYALAAAPQRRRFLAKKVRKIHFLVDKSQGE